MQERYLNPHTDFGFKRLFGSEFNKELLISFLNALFRGEQDVKDITYNNSEQLGDRADARRAIFDVYCENSRGEKFIVEMQNVYQEFFKDRTIYYSTFPIREQAQKGNNWDFHLNSVYTIGLLNFNFAEGLNDAKRWHHEVKLMEVDTKEVFYDKLTYVYVEIPKFNKSESELVTMYDKWMYVLKNLSVLMDRPAALQERVFTRLFEQAEIAKFNPQELQQYEDSVNAYRDIVNAINTAKKDSFAQGIAQGREEGIAQGREEGIAQGREEGIAQGREEGIVQGREEGIVQGREEGIVQGLAHVAKTMLDNGMDVQTISKMTGLPVSDIEDIRKKK